MGKKRDFEVRSLVGMKKKRKSGTLKELEDIQKSGIVIEECSRKKPEVEYNNSKKERKKKKDNGPTYECSLCSRKFQRVWTPSSL